MIKVDPKTKKRALINDCNIEDSLVIQKRKNSKISKIKETKEKQEIKSYDSEPTSSVEFDSENQLSEEVDELDSFEEESEHEDKETSKEQKQKDQVLNNTFKNEKKDNKRFLTKEDDTKVIEIKKMWEKLRKTNLKDKNEKKELCEKIWEISKNMIDQLIYKHDTCRIIQTLYKNLNVNLKDNIVNVLLKYFLNLSFSKYGKHLIKNILLNSNKSQRDKVINSLNCNYSKMVCHKESVDLLELIYFQYSNSIQKKNILLEFWGINGIILKNDYKDDSLKKIVESSSEKKKSISRSLFKLIDSCINKHITIPRLFHVLLKDYLSIYLSEIEKKKNLVNGLLDLLSDQIPNLIYSYEGYYSLCVLISSSGSKERKSIIKSLKDNFHELYYDKYGHLILICLLMNVDDTVLLHKIFLCFDENNFYTFVNHKYGRRPLLYLLKSLSTKYFCPDNKNELEFFEKIAYRSTSKKPQTLRRSELLNLSIESFYNYSLSFLKTNDIDNFFSSNFFVQFVIELILTATDNNQINKSLRSELLNVLFENLFKDDPNNDDHPLKKYPYIRKFLKLLLLGNSIKFDKQKNSLVIIENIKEIKYIGIDLASKILNYFLIGDNFSFWITDQNVFTVTLIYEIFELKQKKDQLNLLKNLIVKNKTKILMNSKNKKFKILLNIL